MPTNDDRTITLGIKFAADKNESKQSAEVLSKMLESELKRGTSGVDAKLKKLQASAVEANKKVEELLKTTESLGEQKLNLEEPIKDLESLITKRTNRLAELKKLQEQTPDGDEKIALKTKYEDVEKSLNNTRQALAWYQQDLEKINADYTEAEVKLNNAVNLERVRISAMTEYKDKILEAQQAEEAKRRTVELELRAKEKLATIEAQKSTTALDSDSQSVLDNFQVMENLRANIGENVKEILNLSSVTDEAKSAFLRLGKAALSAFGKATSNLIGKLKNSVLGLSKSAGKSEFSFKKLLNVLLRYGLGIRGLFMLFRRLRSAISEGLQNLQQFNGGANSTAEAMNSLKDSMLYLKNSWGAAFAPIIEMVVPYLTMVVDKIAEFANALGAIFAILAGKGTMIKATKQIGAAAKATKSGADAQKEWNNQLYSFDELNRQSENSDSSGGAGAGGGFESVNPESILPKGLLDWINKFKELWSAEKFQEIGLMIAEGLNMIISTVHNWIDNTLRPWATKWAMNIANILNGIVAGLGWEELGATVASGLNTWYGVIDTFFQTFNWGLLGKRFGSGLKSAFDNVEWDTLGRAFSDKWKALIEFIYGVVNTPGLWQSIGNSISTFVISWFFNIDWHMAGEAIATGFNGIVTSLHIAVQSIPWLTMAETFIEGLNTMINGIDWAEFGRTVSDWLLMQLGLLVVAIAEFDWQGLGNAIGDFLNNIDWGAVALLVIMGLMALANGLFELLVGLLESAFEGIGDKFAEFGDDGIAGFFKGIADALSNLKQWIQENMVDPLVNAVKDLLGIHSPSTVFSEIGTSLIDGLFEGIKNTWSKITGFFDQSLGPLTSKITDGWNDLKSKSGDIWGNIKTSISNTWTNTKDKLFSTTGNIKTDVTNAWNNLKTTTTTSWNSLKTTVTNSWKNLKTNLRSVSFSDIGRNLVDGIKSGVGGAWDSLVSSVSRLCGSLVDRVRGMFQIHSPSKVFAEIGENLALGLAEGITDESGTPIKAAEDMADSVGDVDTAIEMLPTALDAVLNRLSQIADKFMLINNALLSVSNMAIPRIATGSVVPSSATAGASSSELASNIADAIVSALGEQSTTTNMSAPQDIKIYIRGKEVFNAVVDENNSAIMRTGTSPLMR